MNWRLHPDDPTDSKGRKIEFNDRDGQPPPHFNTVRRANRTVDEMLGMAKGMLADDKLCDAEIAFLQRWLTQNDEPGGIWPISVIHERITRFLCDGIIDEEERKELFDLLQKLVGDLDLNDEIRATSTTLPLDDPPPEIEFKATTFCVTGKFLHGSRKSVLSAITSRGGLIDQSVKKGTEVLVIGAIGSRDWLHSAFGTKIRDAQALRDGGSPIVIVSEQHWQRYL